MNILYKTGKKYLGKDISKTQNELGCAEAVNFIVKEATGEEAGGGLSTIRMYEALLKNKKFEKINIPEIGSIIISPTNGKSIGHAGIISDNGRVMSNNSLNSLWDEHLSIGEWWLKYKNLPIALFRYQEPVIIKEDIKAKKITIIQKMIELCRQIISIKLKNMKLGAFSSSQNPEKLSLTIKSIVAGLLPVVHLITGVELINENTDKVIDAVFVLFTAFLAIKGYIRSKR